MFSYLKGTVADIQKSSNRIVLILEVNQIGYELQVTQALIQQLPVTGEAVQVFTHFQIREEQPTLYGFVTSAERDLFRQLVSVSGIGARGAIALLDTLGMADLVQAIVTGNVRTLSKAPGVGTKTAERLALELKSKLSQWRDSSGLPPVTDAPAAAVQEDVEMTLLALGYNNNEIARAIAAISQDAQVLKSKNSEDWIRSAISWLSQ